MKKKRSRIHIGPRTLKTAAAVIIAMLIVDSYGATTSKLIFAMLGAMAAVEPTFKESVQACLTQIVGVFFGAIAAVVLLATPLSPLMDCGIGIVLIIVLYNALHIRFSPSLPCFILVTICTTPDIQPFTYAMGRIWDCGIGLGVGLLINTLVFPYDNTKQILASIESLDREVIQVLQELFDGDEVMPDSDLMGQKIDDIARQMDIFSKQKLVLHRKRQQEELASFLACEGKARQLLAHMEILSHLDQPGRLNEENRQRLIACGAKILDERALDSVTERDVVTNYHVSQVLTLRQELLEMLKKIKTFLKMKED